MSTSRPYSMHWVVFVAPSLCPAELVGLPALHGTWEGADDNAMHSTLWIGRSFFAMRPMTSCASPHISEHGPADSRIPENRTSLPDGCPYNPQAFNLVHDKGTVGGGSPADGVALNSSWTVTEIGRSSLKRQGEGQGYPGCRRDALR